MACVQCPIGGIDTLFVSEVTYLLMLAREYSVKPVYYGHIQVLVVLVVVSSEDLKIHTDLVLP